MDKLLISFRDYLKINRTHDVVQHHYYNMKQFITIMRSKNLAITAEDITLEDCVQYLNDYKSSPISYWPNKGKLPSHNTVCDKAKSLRVFFIYTRAIGLKTLNWEALPKMKKEFRTIDKMEKQEYLLLREVAFELEPNIILAARNQLMIDVAYHTGLRRSEILQCKFSDFRSPNRQFTLKGKGWYIDEVFFSTDLQTKVFAFEQKYRTFTTYRPIDNDYIFVGLDNRNWGKVLRPKYVNNKIKEYSDYLLKKGALKRKVTLHMARHSFATNCVYAWLSQQATTKLMRHRSPSTTVRYYNMDNAWLQSQYDKIIL